MIIATIAYLTLVVFGGGGFQGFLPNDFNKQVKKYVADSARKEQVLDITKQMEQEVDGYIKTLKSVAGNMIEQNKKYDATAEELQQILNPILTERLKIQRDMVEARFKMRDLMNREEWEAVFNEDEKQKE